MKRYLAPQTLFLLVFALSRMDVLRWWVGGGCWLAPQNIVHTGVDDLHGSTSMQKLWYFPDTRDVVASTNARDIVYWRYNPHAALRVLHGHKNWVEVLATSAPPAPVGLIHPTVSEGPQAVMHRAVCPYCLTIASEG